MFLIRFATKTCDDVRGYCTIRHDSADGIDALQIPFSGISPIHALQHIAVSRLNRQVNVFANVFVCSHCVKHIICHVLRVTGRKTNA